MQEISWPVCEGFRRWRRYTPVACGSAPAHGPAAGLKHVDAPRHQRRRKADYDGRGDNLGRRKRLALVGDQDNRQRRHDHRHRRVHQRDRGGTKARSSSLKVRSASVRGGSSAVRACVTYGCAATIDALDAPTYCSALARFALACCKANWKGCGSMENSDRAPRKWRRPHRGPASRYPRRAARYVRHKSARCLAQWRSITA